MTKGKGDAVDGMSGASTIKTDRDSRGLLGWGKPRHLLPSNSIVPTLRYHTRRLKYDNAKRMHFANTATGMTWIPNRVTKMNHINTARAG
jgi:hypothetical protein